MEADGNVSFPCMKVSNQRPSATGHVVRCSIKWCDEKENIVLMFILIAKMIKIFIVMMTMTLVMMIIMIL